MDRSLPENIIRGRKIRLYINIGVGLAMLTFIMVLIRSFTLISVNINSVVVSEAEHGDMVVTFSATGKVVPVYEEALISPVSSRIMRILCQPGQRVEKGQKLLEIDINNQKYELERLQSVYDQTLNNHTRLGLEILKKEENGNLQHNLQQKKIESLRVEVEQEQYLLSIGGSSPDRLAKLKMELSNAELEFESSKKQLSYNQEITKLELQSLQIDLSIHKNRLNEMKALLARAQMESPVSGTVSFLLDQPGASIGTGEVAARISDLSSFRIEAVAGESYSSQLAFRAGGIDPHRPGRNSRNSYQYCSLGNRRCCKFRHSASRPIAPGTENQYEGRDQGNLKNDRKHLAHKTRRILQWPRKV
jgi:HlyD family secretion protein